MRWRLIALAGLLLVLAVASQFTQGTAGAILGVANMWLSVSEGSATFHFVPDPPNATKVLLDLREPSVTSFDRWVLWAYDEDSFSSRGPAPVQVFVVIPIWNLAALVGLASLPGFWARRRLAIQPGQCGKCGYRVGAAFVCPECGTVPQA